VSDELELDDIQGLVAQGYSRLRLAAFLLLRVTDAPAARRWLAALVPAVTTGRQRPRHQAANVAFTARGLARLGVADDVVTGFAPEFVEGLAAPARARALGDVDESAPASWRWGAGDRAVDAVLLLYGTDRSELDDLLARHAPAPGLDEVARIETVDLGNREHFGFHDGISQPIVSGLSKTAHPELTVRAGEFVLGYPNEYGQAADCPDLGRNGTYLVMRELEQDVDGFWRYCREASGDGDGERAGEALAARMVGRWPGGAPLALSPDRDARGLADENSFGYAELDPLGERCPIGSHARRVNPRDCLGAGADPAESLAISRRHRLLRRGRSYGAAGTSRGLCFVGLNASIARQFEFIQCTWANNPHFGGLYDDADPLIGPRHRGGGTFTVQATPLRRRYRGMPRFVTTRGGAYFLLPGIDALSRLAREPG